MAKAVTARPVLRLLPKTAPISRDTVELLETLLSLARQGEVTGLALGATMKGQGQYITDVTGRCYEQPTAARGMTAFLSDQLAALAHGRDPAGMRCGARRSNPMGGAGRQRLEGKGMPRIPNPRPADAEGEDHSPAFSRQKLPKVSPMVSAADVAGLTHERLRFWMAVDGWTVEDAALLLIGLEPQLMRRWSELTGKPLRELVPVAFRPRALMLERAGEAGLLKFPATAEKVLAWAASKGLDGVDQLRALAGKQGIQAALDNVAKPVARAHVHQQRILACLREMGRDPAALPRVAAGLKDPVKAGARAALVPRLMTDDNFKRAWQQLRADGSIADS
jgi:hypothetical protein